MTRRLNKYVDNNKCPTIRVAIKAENRRLENKNVEKYLSKCFWRMFGDVNPYKRNEGYPFVWHN